MKDIFNVVGVKKKDNLFAPKVKTNNVTIILCQFLRVLMWSSGQFKQTVPFLSR